MEQKVLNRLSCGLFVLTARAGGKDNGCIINTAMQVASDPLLLSVAVNKANLTCEMIREAGRFTLSVLAEDASFGLIEQFGFRSGRDADKFAGFADCKPTPGGMAVTKGTNAWLTVDVQQQLDLGSHMLFLGTPTDGEILSEVPPATYAYYHEYIKPKPQAVGTTPEGQTIWRCVICGYEYVGEELPEDFICPLCKHPASDFEKVSGHPAPEPVGTTPDGQTIWRCTVCGYEYVGEELPEDFVCPLCKRPASAFEKKTK